jgi:predicted RNA-binding Zn-ribbon protein involved in translation (DUF1610 family)
MKKLLMLAVCAMFMITASFAQSSTSSNSTASAKNAKRYYCPKCMAASNKPGTCVKCKAKLVAEGSYYCPTCGTTSDKAGHCAKCNVDMKQMTGKS